MKMGYQEQMLQDSQREKAKMERNAVDKIP